jgi:hypothetical protein
VEATSDVRESSSEAKGNMKQLQASIEKGEASLVTVESEPSGANVDVDYKLLGQTPLSFLLMKTSNGAPRNILVYKDGYAIRDREVKPSGGPILIQEHLISVQNGH